MIQRISQSQPCGEFENISPYYSIKQLIKLLKKGKTWIVFGLFALFIGITIYGQYSGDKNMRMWQSPEKQLEMAEDNLNYYESFIRPCQNLPSYI